MSFLKLFGEKNENNTLMENQDNSKIKRTVFDLFKLDITKLPDDSFIEGEVEKNSNGDIIINYCKSLDYKECGIFDTVEVIVIGESCRNVILKSYQPESIKIEYLKRLIDDLYLIHGNDSSGNGKFTGKDIESYRDREFNCLFGRRWDEYPKYKFPVAVGRNDDEVSIIVSGIGLP